MGMFTLTLITRTDGQDKYLHSVFYQELAEDCRPVEMVDILQICELQETFQPKGKIRPPKLQQ